MTGFTRQRNGRGNTLIQRITAGRSIGFASCAVASPDSCIEMIRENSWHQRAFASGQFYSSEIVMAPEATCEVSALPRVIVKAQLSEAERVWILAYSLTPIGEQEFGPLVSTVGLLNDWNPYPDLRSVLALLPAAST